LRDNFTNIIKINGVGIGFHTHRDIRNVTIREITEVGKNILEVTEDKRLRWFGHVKTMPGNRLPLKVLEWEPEGTRRRGRPKERWINGVRRSMTDGRGY
jgi:hypothetical protein